MRFLSVKEVADLLGFSESHIRKLCREKEIPSAKFGRWIVSEDDLRELIRRFGDEKESTANTQEREENQHETERSTLCDRE